MWINLLQSGIKKAVVEGRIRVAGSEGWKKDVFSGSCCGFTGSKTAPVNRLDYKGKELAAGKRMGMIFCSGGSNIPSARWAAG